MTNHFLAMTSQLPPYTRLVRNPQNLSISAKNTVETTVVTMTTNVPLVTSVRVGQGHLRRDLFCQLAGAGPVPVVDRRPGSDERRDGHHDLVVRLAHPGFPALQPEPGEAEDLRHEEGDGDAPGEVRRVDEASRPELR